MFTIVLLAGLSAAVAGAQQTDTTFAVPAEGLLRLDNHQGSVRVRSWERNSMRVVASHPSAARIRIRRTQTIVRIEAEGPGASGRRVDFEITLPRAYGVTIDAVYAEATVQDVDGPISIENVQGDLVVRGGRGDVRLESVEGDVLVENVRGRVHAETVNKNIRVTGATGDVDAESVNGSIHIAAVDGLSVSAESVNGSLQFDGAIRPGGRYRLSSHNGSIRVNVPAGTDATVSVATHTGNVEADFPVQLTNMVTRGRMSFVLGDGGARLDLESFSGTIRLLRPGAGGRSR
jgi:DUF4097 and DUF4098 domain-containing protein YvlB